MLISQGVATHATSYAGSADVSGPLRVMCCRAIALAQECEVVFAEQAWHLESAVWDWTDAEDKINANGRQWARVTLKDASGQVTLFASEEALLQMTHCHDKDEFMKAFEQDVLPRHRIQGRVHRSIKVEQSRTYVNMVLMEAASMFTIPPEIGVDAAERYRSCLFFPSDCLLLRLVAYY